MAAVRASSSSGCNRPTLRASSSSFMRSPVVAQVVRNPQTARRGMLFITASASDPDDLRRRGRSRAPTPDDTPLRDGNRDRVHGLLTERAVKTLLCYTMETNQTLHKWLASYYNNNQIPREGNWADVSGDTFLRNLMALENTTYSHGESTGMDPMFDNTPISDIEPLALAQRIMDVRVALGEEMIEDLRDLKEENNNLLKEKLAATLKLISYDEDDGPVSDASDPGKDGGEEFE